METTYSCDCSGCSDCSPTPKPTISPQPTNPTVLPTTSLAPTMSPIPTSAPTRAIAKDFDHSFCFAECELGDKIGSMNATLVDSLCAEGEGVVFSDNTQKVTLSGAPMGGSMSLAVWVLTVGGSFVINNFNNDDSANQARIRMRVTGGNRLEFSADDDNAIVTGDEVPENAWTFVVGTVEDGSLNVYQDGKLTGTNEDSAVAAPALVTRDDHVFGRYLVGTLRQFQIWSRVLGAEEIERLYNNTEEGASCLATPTLAPTLSLAPTATVGVSFYMSDTGVDG